MSEFGFNNMTVRFFIYDTDGEGETDLCEVDESEFLQAEGVIEYERHTVFQNGVSQITLTKNPYN